MNKNKLLSLILAVVILVSCFTLLPKSSLAGASDEIVTPTASDFIYLKYTGSESKYIILSQYIGTDTKIRIPEKIEDIPVTEIGESAFSNNDTIEYIEIPAYVTTISPKSFNLCTSLKEIIVSANNSYYSSIDGVLYNKDKTTLLTYPIGKPDTSFTVPESTVAIGSYAFEHCYNLTDVKMYNNVKAIQTNAFAHCWNLKSIKLSDNLANIGAKAFAFCDNLLEIHLPATLKIILPNSFMGGIDSNNNIYYNFTNGIYYVKGTRSEAYVKNLHLTPGYAFAEPRSVTDIDSNITLYDNDGVFPSTGKLDLNVTILKNSDFNPPVRYSDMGAYDVSFTVDGVEKSLSKECVIRFNGLKDAIPTATKVFTVKNGILTEKVRAPQAAFAGTGFKSAQSFVVITNNDFSLKGDIDGDGIHTIYDARFALCITAGLVKNLTPAQKATANVNGSTEAQPVTTKDAIEVLKYAAGISVPKQ